MAILCPPFFTKTECIDYAFVTEQVPTGGTCSIDCGVHAYRALVGGQSRPTGLGILSHLSLSSILSLLRKSLGEHRCIVDFSQINGFDNAVANVSELAVISIRDM